MKSALIALAALALAPAGPALAHEHATIRPTIRCSSCCECPARWGPRHPLTDARSAITTESGDATLLLTREILAVQLSDRAFHRVARELRRHEDDADAEDGGFLGQIIKSAVIGAVLELLDHSAECPIRDVADVEYAHGRLVITTEEGRRLFEDVNVNDSDVMLDFSEHDARAFVREFHRLKSRAF